MKRRSPSQSRLFANALLTVVMLGGLLLAACGDSDDSGGSDQPTATGEATASPTAGEPESTATEAGVVQSDASRVTAPGVQADETQAFVAGLNSFAFDFYQYVAGLEEGNLVYSPASIELAFSMVYAGARGETEAQMADVLGFLPQEDQHPAANALDAHLNSLGEGEPAPGEEAGEPFKLTIANAIWGQEDYAFEEAFLQTLAEHYGAGMRVVDFVSDAEAVRQLINAWIAERTQGRIEEAVPEGFIKAKTRLVLANAIYFKAGWLFPFQESATADGTFRLLDGSEVTVPMMHNGAVRMPYAEGDGYQAAIIPYTGQSVDMVVILPEEGRFDEIEGSLSPEFLAATRDAAATADVNFSMPKYDFDTDLDLKAILPEMGMPDPFGPADFSGMSSGDLFIGEAIHSATIVVDEKGTEAAAVTVIAMEESAMPPAELALDRPFVFAIVDNESGAILFMGRVMNPAG